MPADVAFRIDLPHGRCVGVRVPSSVEKGLSSALLDEEQTFLESLSPARRPTWYAGRIAMHAALRDLGCDAGAILSTPRGAPDLPGQVTGSISHKRTLAVALVARKVDGLSLGVDIEPVPAAPTALSEPGWDNRPDISSRVLTPDELTSLASMPERLRRREVVLRFSLKEALYKAVNPIIGRYVSFQEASTHPHGDGSVTVSLALSKGEGPFHAEGRWSEIDGHILTTATIRPLS
jgi:enterobactin synthetase component D